MTVGSRSLAKCLVGACAVVTATAMSMPAAVAGTPKWSSVSVQTPPGTTGSLSFGTVTCVSKKLCWTAGYAGGNGFTAVMEKWNGKKFTTVHTPEADVDLGGVACPKTHLCWVVGEKAVGNTDSPVLERWNGKKWAAAKVPNPKGNANYLTDVSCPSSHACYAVGQYGSDTTFPATTTTLLLRWNGKKWSQVKSPPKPGGTTQYALTAINCVKVTHCVAGGKYVPNGSYDSHIFSDVLSGHKWSLRSVPQPFTGHYEASGDSDVHCTTAKACVMSGYGAPDAQGRTAYTPEAWKFTGKSWKLLKLPKGYGTNSGDLNDVTCTSAKHCWFVGYNVANPTTGAGQKAVALLWNGHSFHVTKPPQPSNASRYPELDAVGCVHHGACLAVGDASSISSGSIAFGDKTG